ncbi:alpha/beta hydrolase family protein [Vibrio cyclitrophicus 1F53]|uniref:alpha/beta hydrolase family protein n=1 Tax=Vibrio cyclitrophicus TaxID=47951 RepID=UPI0002FAADFE|nr:alpha/beta hydrolase [Vibrio cyclitrophicus]OEF34395.1 hypothetical protein OA7_08495 [Vibrio cyclitrophicus 1F53]OEF67066.1 hypothetical protein OAA_06495 [Vibrio cyclitrophicus 1F175]PMH33293.1 hypothetical protein BCU72_01665 [Vibrio cyclitrophicus]PMH79851.1 hypothetical protein BCU60_18835 [Vibrio cyclitrophicus]
MKEINFISRTTGTRLRGRFIQGNTQGGKSPLVVMLTGDGPKGSKSLSWTNIPPMLAEFGISSFLFDFEGLGYSDGSREDLTVSKGIDNFRSAWEEILREESIDTDNISFFASSFGATVLLLCPDIANKAKSIGLKSPAAFLPDAYFKELGSERFDEWRDSGYHKYNGYNFSIFLDALQHNAFSSAKDITVPCLITQGGADEVVPVQQTTYLYEILSSKDKALVMFEGAGHGYSEGDAWNEMAVKFVSWFYKNMQKV